MRASFSREWRFLVRPGGLFALAWLGGVMVASSWAGSGETASSEQISDGLRLFLTDWSNRSREDHQGDGLGPVFNERSCVACHRQGGLGGSGGSRANVMILINPPPPLGKSGAAELFPGLSPGRSQVLHRFSNHPGYESWRSNVLESNGSFGVRTSYRSTPALFGAGLIDAIPQDVLIEEGRRKFPFFPEIHGRFSVQKQGRIGRFGWKAQTASLGEFVRIACANELGLENPGHHQSPDPLRPEYQVIGFDLTEAECSSLTAFVAALPRPVEPRTASSVRAEQIDLGRRTFDRIGCAACHRPKLGDVDGIYSDLLLHDMGQELSDSGEYYGGTTSPDTTAPNEWRTPPLWGLHDSAPYLHDGRSQTVASAIAKHGGEANLSAGRYAKLEKGERHNLDEFLLSLKAPAEADVAPKSIGR